MTARKGLANSKVRKGAKSSNRIPKFGDFAHSLYWSGSAPSEFLGKKTAEAFKHRLDHRIIFFGKDAWMSPYTDYLEYEIIAESGAPVVVENLARKWTRTFPARVEQIGSRLKYSVDDQYSKVIHVFYTLKHSRGIVVPTDGSAVTLFDNGDLAVRATYP